MRHSGDCHVASSLFGGVLEIGPVRADVVESRRHRSVRRRFCSKELIIIDVDLCGQQIPTCVHIISVDLIDELDVRDLPRTSLNPHRSVIGFRHGPLAESVLILYFSGPNCLISAGGLSPSRPGNCQFAGLKRR